jgi:endoglucanase
MWTTVLRAWAVLAAVAVSGVAGCGGSPGSPPVGPGDGAGGGSSAGGSSGSGAGDASSDGPRPDGAGAAGLHVVMGSGGAPGHIVDGAGNPVVFHGVDRSGTEYACVQGWGIFDGPSDQASIDAMKAWKVNVVRVPLNEDCWLGINGVKTRYGGTAYQQAIASYVQLLNSNGMAAILDLHWAAPGTQQATKQLGMPDADHAPTFWSQVAVAYAGNGSVIFDLFNEPFITDWGCWLKGGSCAKDNGGASFTSAGMATLLKAVRAAGAQNVVIMGGLGYSSDFSQWVASVNSIPTLPSPLDGLSLTNVAASWHEYDFGGTGCPSQYNGYSTSSHCNTGQMTAASASIPSVLSAGFPLVLGESGIAAYQTTTPFSAAQVSELETWYGGFLDWVEAQGQGYLAWDWNTSGSPYLLTSYSGTPTPGFGVTYKAHLAKY